MNERGDDAAPPTSRPLCSIVPIEVLQRYARDPQLDPATRRSLADTVVESRRIRSLREAYRVTTLRTRAARAGDALFAADGPSVDVYDCRNRASLPGRYVPAPAASPDEAVRTVFDTTTRAERFLRDVLGRSSIDDAGGDLVSSVHYRVRFDNCFWNGAQMVYGDGDGEIFTAFHRSADIIGHELTHGVTQHESGLVYEGESGGLNESVSDVFGAVFNQWLAGWDAGRAEGWLIGAGAMGPRARAAGRICLRDMLQPSAAHCLAPQPDTYGELDPAADVHDQSGVANRAFALFARALGGKAWELALPVWYAATTDGRLSSGATYGEFAARTVERAAERGSGPAGALRAAWAEVGVALA